MWFPLVKENVCIAVEELPFYVLVSRDVLGLLNITFVRLGIDKNTNMLICKAVSLSVNSVMT
jgi:hypothetical protein